MKKLFNAELFFAENGIPFYTSGYRQCRSGWIQIECPFCHGFPHMGYNQSKGYFNCYSCGWHSLIDTLKKLGFSGFGKLFERYGHRHRHTTIDEIKRADICKLPKHQSEPLPVHIKYLKKRGLSWSNLQRNWDISFTDQVTKRGYSWRILIPFYYKNQLVTYQARSINPDAELRYRACPAQEEVMDVKQVLYGYDRAVGDTVVVVEGVVDVWKLGQGAVSTQGIDYSPHQVKLLSEYRKVIILFDEENQAQEQAEKLSMDLDMLDVETEIVTLEEHEDPGELSMKEGRKLMRELLAI